ncbi:MAG: HAMP domain-containing protein [Clostridia bacterium]|nr:HAMP domain-containing protein [Clostridia bacterium]
MKLFAKIFICTVLVITIALSITGYIMISGSFKSAYEREFNNSRTQHQMLKFALQSAMIAGNDGSGLTDEQLTAAASRLAFSNEFGMGAAVFSEDGSAVYSTLPERIGSDFEVREGELVSLVEKEDGGAVHIVFSGSFTQSGRTVTLVSVRDITSIFEEKSLSERRFFTTFIIAELAGSAVMLTLALLITRPINRLIKSTRAFAGGERGVRTEVTSSDETGELSRSFNEMAETIEENIEKLELAAKQKDDFTASFAHELKTPLTSVIGYADMIYQRRDLTPEQIHEASGYILNEGMRLEALSLKLMELIVLEKQDFTLNYLPAEEVINDAAATARPMLEGRGTALELTLSPAYVAVEPDLIKTLLLNLIDNGAKAGAKTIGVTGIPEGGGYRITVRDDGRGIPADKLSRIKEAFFMVDKSRSRKEHGAGLGLAIAERIASVHGTSLEFTSVEGIGTSVSFVLKGENAE